MQVSWPYLVGFLGLCTAQLLVGPAGAAECSVAELTEDKPTIIPLQGGETWVEALAGIRGCDFSVKSPPWFDLAVVDQKGDIFGKTVGLFLPPEGTEPFLAIRTMKGQMEAVSLEEVLPSVAAWNTSGVVLADDSLQQITGAWKELDTSDPETAAYALAFFNPYNELDIRFSSVPPGATVWVADYEAGKTEMAARVDERMIVEIELTLNGYQACGFRDGTFERSESPYRKSTFACELRPSP